jgi:hypothetical protein
MRSSNCPARPTKGSALKVFLAPRRFADEHHVRFRIAVGEHQRLGAVAQIAAGKAVKRRAQFGNRAGAGSQRPGVLERRFAGDRQLRRLPRGCDRGRWCPAVDAGTRCRLAARPRLDERLKHPDLVGSLRLRAVARLKDLLRLLEPVDDHVLAQFTHTAFGVEVQKRRKRMRVQICGGSDSCPGFNANREAVKAA